MNATEQQRILQGIVQGLARLAQEGNGMTIPALYTDYLPAELMDMPRDFFTYGVDFLTIAAGGGTGTETFQVQNDSDFLLVACNGTAVDPTDETVARSRDALTIAFQDEGAGRSLQNRAQAFANMVGTAQLPGYWPFPKFIDRSSNFSTTIVNNDGVNDIRVRLSFLGFKVFGYNPGN